MSFLRHDGAVNDQKEIRGGAQEKSRGSNGGPEKKELICPTSCQKTGTEDNQLRRKPGVNFDIKEAGGMATPRKGGGSNTILRDMVYRASIEVGRR